MAAAGEVVTAAARAGEPDRYLAALLAPPSVRADLMALAAFASEIARVPMAVAREPAMGEVRLQWWRDALAQGEVRMGHPVADAVRGVVVRHGLPREALEGVIDARAQELYADPPPDAAALAHDLDRIEGALFALSARVLGAAEGPTFAAAAQASGQAYGLARLLYGLPQALARGRMPLPGGGDEAALSRIAGEMRDAARAGLATARQHVANLPRICRPAFLPLALVEPYLRRSVPPGGRVAPLGRIMRIAAAQWLGGP